MSAFILMKINNFSRRVRVLCAASRWFTILLTIAGIFLYFHGYFKPDARSCALLFISSSSNSFAWCITRQLWAQEQAYSIWCIDIFVVFVRGQFVWIVLLPEVVYLFVRSVLCGYTGLLFASAAALGNDTPTQWQRVSRRYRDVKPRRIRFHCRSTRSVCAWAFNCRRAHQSYMG